MKTLHSTVTWDSGMAFTAEQDGHTFTLDAEPEHGGTDRGVRPKPLVLTAVLGCTGMDVVAMLKKMRVPITGLSLASDGDLADAHPRRYTAIRVRYAFTGPDGMNTERIRRAVHLSTEKYCGVIDTLRGTVPLSYEITINEAPVPLWAET